MILFTKHHFAIALFTLLLCNLAIASESEPKKYGLGWDDGILGSVHVGNNTYLSALINPNFTYSELKNYTYNDGNETGHSKGNSEIAFYNFSLISEYRKKINSYFQIDPYAELGYLLVKEERNITESGSFSSATGLIKENITGHVGFLGLGIKPGFLIYNTFLIRTNFGVQVSYRYTKAQEKIGTNYEYYDYPYSYSSSTDRSAKEYNEGWNFSTIGEKIGLESTFSFQILW